MNIIFLVFCFIYFFSLNCLGVCVKKFNHLTCSNTSLEELNCLKLIHKVSHLKIRDITCNNNRIELTSINFDKFKSLEILDISELNFVNCLEIYSLMSHGKKDRQLEIIFRNCYYKINNF